MAALHFPPETSAAAESDWYRFVLVELNGLGTMLHFDAEQGDGRAAEIARRARAIVDTLSWDPPRSIEQTWAFIESELHEPHDAWGPHQVLSRLGADPERLQGWLRDLPADARAFLTDTKLP